MSPPIVGSPDVKVSLCFCPDFDWVWDDSSKSTASLLSSDSRKVNFHTEYSCGTAAIRGNKELADGQHFWEIKMTSPVYGTDMVGNRLVFPGPLVVTATRLT